MNITLDGNNYPQLLAQFVPQAIDSEAEYNRTLAIAERLTFKKDRTEAEIKFLKLVVVLICQIWSFCELLHSGPSRSLKTSIAAAIDETAKNR